MDARKYTFQVSWSAEDQEFVATVLEFPSLSWLAEDRREALDGLLDLVEEVISDMEENGEKVPEPFGERRYSGRFNVRTSPSLHRELVMTARAEGVSLNTLVNQKLARA
ncbi:type II toxin-antitoxin system HicB family antitoxin [Corynebacterium liangguodongii]|uniref:Toxin-antitoxin system HicB family antitoxin n=1 Tax=Corynebacterium liangguodongii TaxID=2079535 RepID=A0A2S0WEU7_9CORY|nr:type II toxin-antitoxin system HicB family antitoxin [Corynebacterium liangguodongii]AWB84182.1 toxin-antitoxin system HicB family antitoxin [Corynebacterium liangguodongii]PWC00193.1 type II toxin-antitoxin system HicB family antitoxin [Corynebacterium liangguodongii]